MKCEMKLGPSRRERRNEHKEVVRRQRKDIMNDEVS
jgi:hypothetical protein